MIEPQVPENLAQPKRISAMKTLIQNAFSTQVRALEIGVWYGIGSTNIWLENLQEGSELILIDAWKPYASKTDISGNDFAPSNWNYAKMDSLSSDAFLSTFFNIKKFETQNEARKIDVSLIRANSAKLLKLFKEDSFDFGHVKFL